MRVLHIKQRVIILSSIEPFFTNLKKESAKGLCVCSKGSGDFKKNKNVCVQKKNIFKGKAMLACQVIKVLTIVHKSPINALGI